MKTKAKTISLFSKPFSLIVCLFVMSAYSISAAADTGKLTPGEKNIMAVAESGEALRIGKVILAPTEPTGTMTVDVQLDAPEFGEEFLSMRPFRCLQDPKEMLCHLVYPYDLQRKITVNDLTDLEYELLFLFKPTSAYGIDAWNGLYFDLSVKSDGSISGPINEVDLNVLAVPPEDRSIRPISDADLTEAAAGSHRFSRIEIR